LCKVSLDYSKELTRAVRKLKYTERNDVSLKKHIYSVKKTALQCLHAHTNQIVTVIQLVHNYQGSTSNFLENLLQSVSENWPPTFIKDGQPDSYNQESNLMKVSDISACDVASGHRRLTIYVKAFGIFPQLNFPIGDVYDRRGK
jgi:hypothetical protein